MEETRETLAMMEVENTMDVQRQMEPGMEATAEKASGKQGGGLFDLARRGLDILREKLQGRAVWKSSEDGRLIVGDEATPSAVGYCGNDSTQ